jgi:hypothetical protein
MQEKVAVLEARLRERERELANAEAQASTWKAITAQQVDQVCWHLCLHRQPCRLLLHILIWHSTHSS